MMARPPIKALLFDKDGTLFDFRATWDGWAFRVMTHLADGRDDVMQALARDARFDLETQSFLPDSPIIAGTHAEATAILARNLPDWDIDDLSRYLDEQVAVATLAPAVPLSDLLRRFQTMSLLTGVMTNDSEENARAHLGAVNVTEMFDMIIGYDSGYGAKPDPDPLLAFAQRMGCAPEQVAMVGDSRHDLIAAQAAGMVGVGVLTGTAGHDDLADLAEIVLPDIGHIPEWLGQRARK